MMRVIGLCLIGVGTALVGFGSYDAGRNSVMHDDDILANADRVLAEAGRVLEEAKRLLPPEAEPDAASVVGDGEPTSLVVISGARGARSVAEQRARCFAIASGTPIQHDTEDRAMTDDERVGERSASCGPFESIMPIEADPGSVATVAAVATDAVTAVAFGDYLFVEWLRSRLYWSEQRGYAQFAHEPFASAMKEVDEMQAALAECRAEERVP